MCDHSRPLKINLYEANHMKDVIIKKSCMASSITDLLFWSTCFYCWHHKNVPVAILIVGL